MYKKIIKRQLPVTGQWVVQSEDKVLSCVCGDEAEADFVMGALNACISINPEHPEAVADGMEDGLKLFAKILSDYEHCAPDEKGGLTPKRKDYIKKANQFFARIGGK